MQNQIKTNSLQFNIGPGRQPINRTAMCDELFKKTNMKKDFDTWNTIKKNISDKEFNGFVHEREIWWCFLGINVGFEQDGDKINHQRPVLILKVLSNNTCLVIPLTTSLKEHRMRKRIGKINGKVASALISQIKVINTKRLVNKIGIIKEELFYEVRKTVRDLF